MNKETYEETKAALREVRAESSALAQRRRAGKLLPEDFQPLHNRTSRRAARFA